MKFTYDEATLRDIYEDALPCLDRLLSLLSDVAEANDTPEGRTKFELEWLRQQVSDGKLSIPQEWTGGMPTIRRAGVAEGALDSLHPEVRPLLLLLYYMLYKGRPRLRPKYLWLVTKWIDYILYLFASAPVSHGLETLAFLSELARAKEQIAAETLILPVQPADLPLTAMGAGLVPTADGSRTILGSEFHERMAGIYSELEIALFYGLCPVEAPDLPARSS